MNNCPPLRLLLCFIASSPLIALGVLFYLDTTFGFVEGGEPQFFTKALKNFLNHRELKFLQINTLRIGIACALAVFGFGIFLRESIFHVPPEQELRRNNSSKPSKEWNEVLTTFFCLRSIVARSITLLISFYGILSFSKELIRPPHSLNLIAVLFSLLAIWLFFSALFSSSFFGELTPEEKEERRKRARENARNSAENSSSDDCYYERQRREEAEEQRYEQMRRDEQERNNSRY